MNEAATSRWPWAFFVAAAAWSVLIRVPLVLNAANHLDSDLAVDGLTLLDATRGHWRWHYPGTPFIGIGPVVLSLPQALVWGANPVTLVSGGVVAWLGLMLATFLLAWKAFGPRVAVGALVPLTFASTGSVWLSGRITGGHLTAAIWHAEAFALLAVCLEKGRGRKWAALLGVWCGFGIALDSMVVVTLAGLIAAAAGFWMGEGVPRRGVLAALVFIAGFLAGVWPRYVGESVDPYDAYRGQFAPVTDPALLASHGRILAADCLPRLIAGRRLPALESDPDPASISSPATRRRETTFDAVGLAVVVWIFPLSVAASVGLARAIFTGPSATRAVALGLIVSALATIAGFLTNRNIVNSDHYRYLVDGLVPWSLGFGIIIAGLVRKGRGGLTLAVGLAILTGVMMTADLTRWYARFGWIDERGRPISIASDDPTLVWLDAHPEVTWIEGGYWDVYRLSFLTGGRVRGKPFPIYPDRFPEWRPAPGSGQATIVRPSPEALAFREAAIQSGRRVVYRVPGVLILAPP